MGAKTGPEFNLTHLFLEKERWRWAASGFAPTQAVHLVNDRRTSGCVHKTKFGMKRRTHGIGHFSRFMDG